MDNQNKDQVSETANSYNGESDSLEAQTTSIDTDDGASAPAPAASIDIEKPKKKFKFSLSPRRLLDQFNIYLLLIGLLLLITGVVIVVSVIQSRKSGEQAQTQIATEPLSEEALEQLRQTDVKVGDAKQILTVESNAIFAGKVLIRDSLEVAGEIKAGGPLSLPGLTVSGSSTLGQVQANQLQVAGAAVFQSQVSIQNNLAVNGSGSFAGSLSAASLNIQTLQINGDIQFTRHIDAGGGTPSKSNGPALGNGGTSSISGTDSAGSIAINTGSGTAPGCFATITFAQKFNDTPHVIITPVGASAAKTNYYINRTGNGFSICTENAAPASQSFAFDYIAID